jgi:hypothetical protein
MGVMRMQVKSPGNWDLKIVSLLSDFVDMSFAGHDKRE